MFIRSRKCTALTLTAELPRRMNCTGARSQSVRRRVKDAESRAKSTEGAEAGVTAKR